MIPLGKQIQTSLRLISVSLSNVLYCIYDVSVVSRCTLYLNKILFTLSSIRSAPMLNASSPVARDNSEIIIHHHIAMWA